jgi:hypothetical protein
MPLPGDRFDVQVVRDGARKTGNFKRGNER